MADTTITRHRRALGWFRDRIIRHQAFYRQIINMTLRKNIFTPFTLSKNAIAILDNKLVALIDSLTGKMLKFVTTLAETHELEDKFASLEAKKKQLADSLHAMITDINCHRQHIESLKRSRQGITDDSFVTPIAEVLLIINEEKTLAQMGAHADKLAAKYLALLDKQCKIRTKQTAKRFTWSYKKSEWMSLADELEAVVERFQRAGGFVPEVYFLEFGITVKIFVRAALPHGG
ncbi:hypothetical protein MMC06_000314 [Schaereria dolodes]|nr:hypothetical protein [Schaereria dolodes]